MKKLLALVAMTIALMGVMVINASATDVSPVTVGTEAELRANLSNGGTVELTSNITITDRDLIVYSDVTIDGNGQYTIDLGGSYAICLDSAVTEFSMSDITVTNVAQYGAIQNRQTENIDIVLTGVTIKYGTLNSGISGHAIYNYSGAITATDCTFVSIEDAINNYPIRICDEDSAVVITNCTFTYTTTSSTNMDIVCQDPSAGWSVRPQSDATLKAWAEYSGWGTGTKAYIQTDITMDIDVSVAASKKLTINSGATLTIASGATLTGEGTVVGTDDTSVLVLEAANAYDSKAAGTYVWDATDSGAWAAIYEITFDAGSGTCATESLYTGVDGTLSSIPTASRSSYTFKGWTGSGTDTYASTSTMFTEDTTLTAYYTKKATTTTTTPDDTEDEVVEETTTDTAEDGATTTTVATETTTEDGTTSATVADETITNAIESAVTTAEGETAYVEIAVAVDEEATVVEVALTTDAVTAIAGSDVEALVITTDLATVELSSDALEAIASQATGSDIVVVVDQVDAEVLTEEQATIIGEDALVVDLSVLSDGVAISSFGGHTITVSIPYELREGELAENIVIWYVADDGIVTAMATTYNEETGMATFKTTHFSVYVIMHDTNAFVDVTVNDWFYDAVLWAVDTELTTGVTDTTFEPNTTCNRATAVTLLYRLAGQPAVETELSFSDVGDAWYTNAVLWAVDAGVTKGTGDGAFSPDETCTRAEIVTFLYRYAGEPEVEGENTFADVSDDAWYANAVIWAAENGITTGTGDGFSPSAVCTRAEIVTFLYRYMAQ